MHEAAKKKFRAANEVRGAAFLSRAVLLLHLQIVLVFLIALTFFFVLAYTGAKERSFYLALTSAAFLVVAGGMCYNFAGNYRPALVLTVLAMFAGPWASIVYERIVNSGDLIPTIYVIIPVQLSALFLSGRAMAAIGVLQSAGFCVMVFSDPARSNYNWGSLVCFVLFASALGAVTSVVFRRQYDSAVGMREALEESERRLTDISRHDALTGLFNRRHMEDVLNSLIGKPEPRFGVAMVDVDNYKGVNDKYGHACGDELIREIGGAIVSALASGDVAFRYGGDEFLITLSGKDVDAAQARGEAIRRAVEAARYACLGTERIAITASVGVSFFPDCGSDKDAVLRAADRALYVAKKTGKNRVVTCRMLQDAVSGTGA